MKIMSDKNIKNITKKLIMLFFVAVLLDVLVFNIRFFQSSSYDEISFGASHSLSVEGGIVKEDGTIMLDEDSAAIKLHVGNINEHLENVRIDVEGIDKTVSYAYNSEIGVYDVKVSVQDEALHEKMNDNGKTKLENDDYLFLERYLDATKANLFFAKAVMMVEGPSEELLIPTIARIMGKDFTEYGISMVNVRGTGLRRFSRILQRADETESIDVKVACITDRDVMPDCAPALCIDNKYSDKAQWPEKNNRNWRTESDFADDAERGSYLEAIRDRADGQQVKTFIADHWTFEYDLAYAGLNDELIEAIVQTAYVKENWESKKTEIKRKYAEKDTSESKAAYLYSFFTSKKASKAEVAQSLAIILESKYSDDPTNLRSKLPQYIKDAIEYIS